jgi:hypothetical protein
VLKIRVWILGGRSLGTQIPVGDDEGEISGFVTVGDRSFTFTAGTVSLFEVKSTDNTTTMRSGVISLTAIDAQDGGSISVTGEFTAKSVATGPGNAG